MSVQGHRRNRTIILTRLRHEFEPSLVDHHVFLSKMPRPLAHAREEVDEERSPCSAQELIDQVDDSTDTNGVCWLVLPLYGACGRMPSTPVSYSLASPPAAHPSAADQFDRFRRGAALPETFDKSAALLRGTPATFLRLTCYKR